ncbi:uncharacterized protein LOC109725239 isoform X2 [Ananas comosus]|uniref:Uncharacterized protein LOC109725239 isoform X2 n=1 Tax=Ananas comosus TaxID=4615 RepID=A0A6P5GPW1_ANACO|nr:uncharacterized protein LOC109725239 isoform X2 [Ananas comosus]
MDAVDSVVDPLREFAKDSFRLVKRCHKPDRKDFRLNGKTGKKTAQATLIYRIANKLLQRLKWSFFSLKEWVKARAATAVGAEGEERGAVHKRMQKVKKNKRMKNISIFF